MLSAADLLAFAYQGTTESASGAARVALSTGRPVLTTPEPIFESLGPTVHRSAGWSVEAIATAIIALARDRVALGSTEDAQRTWIRLYSYSRLTTRLSNILKGSIADFRPRSVDVARGIALTRSSIDIVAPLCPPGIRYPEQGAMFGWREKLIALDADSTILRDELDEAKPTVFVRWNADRLWLEAPNEIGVSTPLHLHRDLRHCLDHSALILSEISRAALSTKQSAALLLYARRHGLRVALVMVPSNRASFDQSAFLADVLLFAGEAERKTWLRSAMQATSWRERSRVVSLLPQLHILGERALSYLHESATLRMVTIYSNGSSNPLLDALGRRAAQINASAGRDVLRFDREASIPAEDDSDWAIAVIGAPEAQRNCPVFEANRGRRRWIGVVAQETSEELRNREAVLSFIAATERFELLIFTSAPDYRRTLAKICAHGDIIALLRRKCVLLESAVARNDEELVERFARVLRLRKPTPSTALWKAFPKLSARPFERSRKKLSVCVSTYNRAHWLRVTIPLWAADIARYRRQVEFVVVDNASTDDTELVMLDLSTRFDIVYHRNSKNVGMLGNLAVTAEHASGDYVWILGDDDLVKPGTVGNLLKVINRHPRTELIYLNYSYTHFDSPDDLKDVDELMRSATAIAEPTESKFHEKIVEFAAHNENFFTAIYACVFRRDHALGAFCQFTDDPPFSSMRSCIPTTKYVLENMLDRPGFWVGSTQLVVNMNVSWIRYAPIWHMERLVEVFDLAEERGVPPEKIMRYRRSNIGQVLHFLPKIFEENDVYVAEIVNMQRYIESAKRVDRFAGAADELLRKYETGRRKGRLFDTRSLSTTSLRVVYGIESVSDGRRVNFTNGHEFGFGRSLV
ncbi:glycosyltransferase family 2 protein [Methylocystis sp. JR02]|uniref:glycosyltransferase family 2 protein n=1 Tax=Methylocystis sp. JR02 TaxID=3046284 RepID=UPI0024BA379E|nr:glycosyltransferase family 2 protein [Methylocystis sp. JR02]MDJ0447123.1 glycosyltransferase [Methylocystis sp. JR02]